jgi:carboxyl-terminal processing protease
MLRKTSLIALLIGSLFSGCKKNIPGILPPDQYAGTDFNQIFQAYWTGMNNRYVFWSIDTVNWDNMYRVFQPKFAKLQLTSAVDLDSAHAYFTQMATNLIDNHYKIFFDVTALATISPADLRKTNILPALSLNFFRDSLTKYYLGSWIKGDSGYVQSIAGKSSTITISVVSGIIQQHILYFHLNNCYLKDDIDSLHPYWLTRAWNYFLENLHNPTVATKGLIIDVRSNGGGDLDDMNFIVGEIVPQSTVFGYTRSKSGNGRLDYTPWADATVTVQNGSAKYAGPIVVLTDQHTVSMAEQTTMALKTLPNTVVIGDTTWGANGPLTTSYDLYDGGQFGFANFGYVFTSSSMFKYVNGEIYEGKGFPPDIFVRINPDSVKAGRDVQLQAAINYLNSK